MELTVFRGEDYFHVTGNISSRAKLFSRWGGTPMCDISNKTEISAWEFDIGLLGKVMRYIRFDAEHPEYPKGYSPQPNLQRLDIGIEDEETGILVDWEEEDIYVVGDEFLPWSDGFSQMKGKIETFSKNGVEFEGWQFAFSLDRIGEIIQYVHKVLKGDIPATNPVCN
jgi:hypothetical protein